MERTPCAWMWLREVPVRPQCWEWIEGRPAAQESRVRRPDRKAHQARTGGGVGGLDDRLLQGLTGGRVMKRVPRCLLGSGVDGVATQGSPAL